VDVCDNSCVDEVDECVVYKSSVDRAGMEDGEVGVFDARGVEVGIGEGASVQSHTIDRVALLATSLNSHTISN
jgi:hypothetical protein